MNEAAADTADIIPVLKESFQFCYEKSEEIVEKIKDRFAKRGNNHPGHGPPHGHHHHCPPQAGIMFGCAMMKTFQECPDSIWTGSDECNEAREYFNECMHVHEEENDTENEIDDYYENEE